MKYKIKNNNNNYVVMTESIKRICVLDLCQVMYIGAPPNKVNANAYLHEMSVEAPSRSSIDLSHARSAQQQEYDLTTTAIHYYP